MNAELLDMIAAGSVVALAVWVFVRTLRSPAGCGSCPTAPEADAAKGTRVALSATRLSKRRHGQLEPGEGCR